MNCEIQPRNESRTLRSLKKRTRIKKIESQMILVTHSRCFLEKSLIFFYNIKGCLDDPTVG